MDRVDYIRQVDAMDLPDSLRQRLGTLPTKGKNGPARAPGTTSRGGHHSISRWAGIAAALVLVVGLGVAAPYLFPTLFTGGELTPPPVATNPSVPNPEGIIAEGLEVSDVLLDAAKEYVRAQYDYWTELHGARPGVPTPAVYDNWRIEGITAVYERKQLGTYTVAVFRLDYRIHTTTPEITRNYLVGGMDLDDEGWLQPVAPGSTYLVFPLNYSTPHSFGMVTDGVSPGTEQFDRDLLAALEREFSPAISDEELTELLAAEFPETTENDTYSLLYSATQRGRTMGALLYRGGGHYVLGTIIVGVFDNETKAPVREIQIHTGDLGEAVGVVGREQVVYLLWTNCMGRGVDWVAGLYTFSHGELTAVTELPPYTVEGTLPDGALTMLDPERSADFWADHKAVINGVGLDLYNRNPEYHYIRNNEVEEWLFACSIQFQFSTGPDVAPILSDEVLTELLAAEFPEARTSEDTWKLIGSSGSMAGRTMGVLQYEWSNGTYPGGDYSNLLLGVFDNATQTLTGPVIRVKGHSTYAYHYTLPSANGPENYVLCISACHGQGMAENYNAALYLFDGQTLRQVTSSPGAELPAGMEDMFNPEKSQAFWGEMDRKIILAPGGFELFQRNFNFQTPGVEDNVRYWRYERYVPLGYRPPDIAVMETARAYFVDYYKDDPEGSSDYSIDSCELMLGFGPSPWPGYKDYSADTAAYRVVLRPPDWSDEEGLERYFVFDAQGELIDVGE